jgi:hypothetical protein
VVAIAGFKLEELLGDGGMHGTPHRASVVQEVFCSVRINICWANYFSHIITIFIHIISIHIITGPL